MKKNKLFYIIFCLTLFFTFVIFSRNTKKYLNEVSADFFAGADIILLNNSNADISNISKKILNFQDILIIANYHNSTNIAVYDPLGYLHDHSSKARYIKNRYFGMDDYINKTDAKIQAKTNFCDDSYIHCFHDIIKLPTTAKTSFDILNLFSNTQNIKHIFIAGKDFDKVSNILLENGFVKASIPYVSIFTSTSYMASTNIVSMVLIYMMMLVIPAFILYHFIDFYIQKNDLRIHTLYGLSRKKIISQYFIPFLLKIGLLSILTSTLVIAFLYYVNMYSLHLFNILEINILLIGFTFSSYCFFFLHNYNVKENLNYA